MSHTRPLNRNPNRPTPSRLRRHARNMVYGIIRDNPGSNLDQIRQLHAAELEARDQVPMWGYSTRRALEDLKEAGEVRGKSRQEGHWIIERDER